MYEEINLTDKPIGYAGIPANIPFDPIAYAQNAEAFDNRKKNNVIIFTNYKRKVKK